MNATADASANWSLKEDIRSYWSQRSSTFDELLGHRILPGPEHEAWAATIREHLGEAPLDVLELASGTGEVTKVLVSRRRRHRHRFPEAMVERSRTKHRGEPRARFLVADAERTMQPDARYDAVVCRHLVWTLTEPVSALRDWARILKPGGRLLVFDGDFVNLPLRGRLARRAMTWLEPAIGASRHQDPELAAHHAAILRQLPFSGGLDFELACAASPRGGLHRHPPRQLCAHRAGPAKDRRPERLAQGPFSTTALRSRRAARPEGSARRRRDRPSRAGRRAKAASPAAPPRR